MLSLTSRLFAHFSTSFCFVADNRLLNLSHERGPRDWRKAAIVLSSSSTVILNPVLSQFDDSGLRFIHILPTPQAESNDGPSTGSG